MVIVLAAQAIAAITMIIFSLSSDDIEYLFYTFILLQFIGLFVHYWLDFSW